MTDLVVSLLQSALLLCDIFLTSTCILSKGFLLIDMRADVTIVHVTTDFAFLMVWAFYPLS